MWFDNLVALQIWGVSSFGLTHRFTSSLGLKSVAPENRIEGTNLTTGDESLGFDKTIWGRINTFGCPIWGGWTSLATR